MDRRVSCPGCDVPVGVAEQLCPRCGFALIEDRLKGRRVVGVLPRAAACLTALAVMVGVAASPARRALSRALAPASEAISAADAERHLAARYPRLRQADHAVIACPDRRIDPGGQARCWILARVGQQRSVVVRLSPRGNAVEVDD
jgi:hypothetical protein